MTRLQGRLRKIEASIVDGNGLIPHTPRWLEHWMMMTNRLIDGEKLPGVAIPLAAARAMIAHANRFHESDNS